MSSVAAIRDAIKTTLDTALSDVHLYDFVPDNPTLPAVAVAPALADFDVAFGRGIDTWEFELLVLTARGSDRAGQERLDQLVTGAGSSSIRQVIFNDQRLGGVVDSAHVSGLIDYRPTDVAGVTVYAARLRLVVLTSGTT
jgi:hypothetical protein